MMLRTGRAKVWRFRTLRMTLSLWKCCSQGKEDRCFPTDSQVLVSLLVLSPRHLRRAYRC